MSNVDEVGVPVMITNSKLAKIVLGAIMMTAITGPAYADVKAGVDAWSRGEYEIAVKYWDEAALKGDADAQFNIGQAYQLGRGVKADLAVALDWYNRAAAQGHLKAADSYGHLLHHHGKVSESLPYLQSSAERGDPRSQYLLGTELFNGFNVEKDWVRAYALMIRASSAGMGPASRSLAQMDRYVPLEQRQQATVLAGELEQKSTRPRAAQVSGFPTAAVALTKPAAGNAAPVDAAKAVGNWRVQLGAFGSEGNAIKLWTTLQSKIIDLAGLKPNLKAAGSITRLQAGPFATRSAADAVCEKVKATGQACLLLES